MLKKESERQLYTCVRLLYTSFKTQLRTCIFVGNRDKMKRNREMEKDYAKSLFLEGKTRKDIAQRLSRTEKTIGKWAVDGKWEEMKRSLMVTKETQINSLYIQLEQLNKDILERKIIYDIPAALLKPVRLKKGNDEVLEFPSYNPEDYPIKVGNTPTSKEADIISKITASINRLETETSIGEIVEVSKQLIQFVQAIDFPFAKKLTDYIDVFISDKMK